MSLGTPCTKSLVCAWNYDEHFTCILHTHSLKALQGSHAHFTEQQTGLGTKVTQGVDGVVTSQFVSLSPKPRHTVTIWSPISFQIHTGISFVS